MNTQAHIIIQTALFATKPFSKQKKNEYIAPAIIGAIIPDFTMFIFFIVETFILRTPQEEIWQVKYFLPQWQVSFNIFNSMPFILLLLCIGLCIKKYMVFKNRKTYVWVIGVSASMLLHVISDFFLHHSDGHAHFFPFSNFIFQSPISYWEQEYFGILVASIELLLTLLSTIYLYAKLVLIRSKISLVLLFFTQILMFVASFFMFWHV